MDEEAIEKAGAGLQLLVWGPVEVAALLEALHALRDPGLGGDSPERGEHRVRGDHLVLGVVVLELLQVRRVECGLLGIQRHRGLSDDRTIVR